MFIQYHWKPNREYALLKQFMTDKELIITFISFFLPVL